MLTITHAIIQGVIMAEMTSQRHRIIETLGLPCQSCETKSEQKAWVQGYVNSAHFPWREKTKYGRG